MAYTVPLHRSMAELVGLGIVVRIGRIGKEHEWVLDCPVIPRIIPPLTLNGRGGRPKLHIGQLRTSHWGPADRPQRASAERLRRAKRVQSSWATKVSEIGQQALLGTKGIEESQGRKDHGIRRPCLGRQRLL